MAAWKPVEGAAQEALIRDWYRQKRPDEFSEDNFVEITNGLIDMGLMEVVVKPGLNGVKFRLQHTERGKAAMAAEDAHRRAG